MTGYRMMRVQWPSWMPSSVKTGSSRGRCTGKSFWKLIDDDRGKMFGVFSYPEKQMIYDWIQGPQSTSTTSLRGWARKHEQKNQNQDRPEDIVDFELTF